MALNPTVVFEEGPLRACGIAAGIGLALVGLWRWLRSRQAKRS